MTAQSIPASHADTGSSPVAPFTSTCHSGVDLRRIMGLNREIPERLHALARAEHKPTRYSPTVGARSSLPDPVRDEEGGTGEGEAVVPPLCPRRASQESRNPGLTRGGPWNRTADLLPTREKPHGHRGN